MNPERRILVFTCVAHALTHTYMLIFTPLLEPMRASFGLSLNVFTQYAMISNILFGLGALPAGWLGDRYGEQRLLVAFFWLTALGGLVVGLAQGPMTLAAGMGLLGLGTSIFHPVGNSLLAKSARFPGKAMGVNGLWGSIGTAAGPLYAWLLTSWTGSWRWSYIGLFLPMVLLGFALAAAPLESDLEEEEATPPVPDPTARTAKRAGPSLTLVVLLLLGATTCGGLTFHLITTMLPTLAGASDSLARGSWIASGIYLIGGAGQIIAGWFVDRCEGRGLYVAVLATSAPLVWVVGQLQGGPLLWMGGAMAVFLFAVQPVENVLLARYAPPGRRGAVFGMKFILAFGLGGLGTGLAGAIAKNHGVPTVFTVAAAVTATAAGLALAARYGRRPA